MENKEKLRYQIDWISTLIPFAFVFILFIIFSLFPDYSKELLNNIRNILGDKFGIYYAILGIGTFLCSIIIAFSKIGNIRLGDSEKPLYSNFKWGTMIFTSTMAADILFYSFCEWALYANEPYIEHLGGIQKWASTYPLFHWGPIAWSFYIILAVAFGFMLYVRKRNIQKFSEACRPVLGKRTDGKIGKVIDLIAIFALISGVATTFSLATPLISSAINHIFGLQLGTSLSIIILLMIVIVYTITVNFGMKAISKLANFCIYLFVTLLLYFLLLGGEARYILETGLSSIGNLIQNFVGMATWTDPLRETSFPQNWTFYYWAYWMVWCVATPFFIGSISKGRSIKNVIFGGYGWGLAGTFTSFIILGNYGMAQQLKYGVDISNSIQQGTEISDVIVKIFETMPLQNLGLILLIITMILFYATTLDALTMVVSSYSYKKLEVGKEPAKRVKIFWSIVFIILPIALIFANNSMAQLQSISIIAAFPIGIAIILIIVSFIKDAKRYINEKEQKNIDMDKEKN